MLKQAEELEIWKGGTRNREYFMKELGTDLEIGTEHLRSEYSNIYEDLGFPNKILKRTDLFKYTEMTKISENGQLISAHYPIGNKYHTSLISKIVYTPKGKVIVYPGNGYSFNLLKFLNRQGTRLRFFHFF